ncbi:hypothetical protein [Sorangium sp. So ce1153]|uniref:hypothetical protein n=1 Tax=Sorangium sp. So ce1153 TaxID=3133333 RepID=UPI003F5EB686
MRKLRRVGAGCYGVEPAPFSFLWIAANELPLRDELVPFLVARSGRPLDEFARWVATRRRKEWVINMVQHTTMSTKVSEEVLRDFARTDDPEVLRRRRLILKVLLEECPEDAQQLLIEQGIEAGRLVEARAVLRRLLTRRQLAPSADELARIEACGDLVTLERWLDQSLTAETAADALR